VEFHAISTHGDTARAPGLAPSQTANANDANSSGVMTAAPAGAVGFSGRCSRSRHRPSSYVAALVSATKNLARSLAPEGILVNCLCPGWVLTPSIEGYLRDLARERGLAADDLAAAFRAGTGVFGSANDLGRIGRPEEVAVMAAVLCSPLAGFTVGATIPVDGGTDF